VVRSPDGATSAFTRVFNALLRNPGFPARLVEIGKCLIGRAFLTARRPAAISPAARGSSSALWLRRIDAVRTQHIDWKKPVRNVPSAGIEHEERTMFAVIRTGGKQYRVAAEDVIKIEKVAGDPGEIVQFGEVLLVGGDNVTVGAPTVAGASVAAEVLEQGRGPKVIAFKKRRRKNSRRKRGHRQEFTLLRVTEILTDGAKPTKSARPKRTATPTGAGEAAGAAAGE
jgi:large subunit ribosomal protein L21